MPPPAVQPLRLSSRWTLAERPPADAEALGREVRVGEVALDLYPRMEITLGGVEIEGGPGEPLLARAERSVIHPRLWPLLRSLGSQVEVASLVMEDVQLALVKRPDGSELVIAGQ